MKIAKSVNKLGTEAVYNIFARTKKLIEQGLTGDEDYIPQEKTKVNWWILGGSLVFVIFTLSVGSFKVPYAQEIVFLGSMIIVLFLMNKLVKELPKKSLAIMPGRTTFT